MHEFTEKMNATVRFFYPTILRKQIIADPITTIQATLMQRIAGILIVQLRIKGLIATFENLRSTDCTKTKHVAVSSINLFANPNPGWIFQHRINMDDLDRDIVRLFGNIAIANKIRDSKRG